MHGQWTIYIDDPSLRMQTIKGADAPNVREPFYLGLLSNLTYQTYPVRVAFPNVRVPFPNVRVPFPNVRVPFPNVQEPFPNVRVPFPNVREPVYLGLK